MNNYGQTCPACNGVIGRDCFNPEECMAITQDQAARYREQSQAESNCEQCEAALIQCQGEIQDLAAQNNELRTQLACCCDLINSWCREVGSRECKSPYGALELRNTVDELWSKVSSEFAKASEQ